MIEELSARVIDNTVTDWEMIKHCIVSTIACTMSGVMHTTTI